MKMNINICTKIYLKLIQLCLVNDKIDGLVQHWCNSIANALELLLSSTKPLRCFFYNSHILLP